LAGKNKHTEILGVNYDPNNDMKLKPKKDGDVDVDYKGGKMTFDEYVDEMEDRMTSHAEGKKIKTSSMFSGFGKGTLKKPYKIK
tara:strand:+ start:586 stop:837 length:252 start_codon:yes stop_codon:yes gene_type:complete